MGIESVKEIILVLSGKGGVGKSSVSAQLAVALSRDHKKVGLLDVDLCGPSIPRIFNAVHAQVVQAGEGWQAVQVSPTLGIMSIGFLLPHPDDAVVWRGPKKTAMIRQFLQQVSWGPLDVLVVDTPPGTSDEHLALVESLHGRENVSAVIVTTPQLVALQDVEREVLFCREVGISIRGVIENMSGYECPHCAHCTNLFSSGGGEALAARYELPFLARLPVDPRLAVLLDAADEDDESNAPKNQKTILDSSPELLARFDPVLQALFPNREALSKQ